MYVDITLTTPCPLGDAFLKYLSTVYVFVTYPSHSEGALHTARQRIISNKSLFQNARHVGLPAYIQAKPFAPRQWHPPNFVLNQLSRAPDNKATQGPTSGDDVEDSQSMDPAGISSTDPAPQRSFSQRETQTATVPAKKPNKKNKKQMEETQWLGDKVMLLQSFRLSRLEYFSLYIGYRRCCRGHHRSCVYNRGA
jgi:endoribonuclease Dicer